MRGGLAGRTGAGRHLKAMGIRLALHRGAGRTAVPVRSAVASAAVGVAALSAGDRTAAPEQPGDRDGKVIRAARQWLPCRRLGGEHLADPAA